MSKEKDREGQGLGFIVPITVVGIIGVIACSSFTIIPTGYAGVKISFGQVQETPVRSGAITFHMPFVESVQKVNNKQQDVHIESQIWGEALDKTPVYASDVTVTCQILPEKSAWLYANVSDKSSLVSDALVASAIKSAMVELSTEDVTNRSKIEPLTQEKLTNALTQKYGGQ